VCCLGITNAREADGRLGAGLSVSYSTMTGILSTELLSNKQHSADNIAFFFGQQLLQITDKCQERSVKLMFHTKPSHGNTSPKKVCVSCKTAKDRSCFQPGKRQCEACAVLSRQIDQKQRAAWHAQYAAAAQRAWRARNPDYDRQYYHANREAKIARVILGRAIRAGTLPRAADCTCSQCGQPAHEYHIADYAQPLVATPVCRSCRRRLGKEQKGQTR